VCVHASVEAQKGSTTTVQAELSATYRLATEAWSCLTSTTHPQQARCLLYSIVLIVNKPFKAPPAFTSNHALLHGLKCVGKQDRYKSSKGVDVYCRCVSKNIKPIYSHIPNPQHFVRHTFSTWQWYIFDSRALKSNSVILASLSFLSPSNRLDFHLACNYNYVPHSATANQTIHPLCRCWAKQLPGINGWQWGHVMNQKPSDAHTFL
jgi:hypothetical protein